MADFVVVSKLKDLIKQNEMQCAGDFAEALDKHLQDQVKRAVERAKSNDRKTVRAGDL